MSSLASRNRNHWAWPVAVSAALMVVTLCGCTAPTASGPSDSPSSSATSHAEGTFDPPANTTEAFEQANRVVSKDQEMLFAVFSGQLDAEALASIEAGAYLEATGGFIQASEGGVVSGAPDSWVPDPANATAKTLEHDGKSYPFGEVTLQGCLQTGYTIAYEGDSAPSGVIGQYFPTEVVVQYEPTRRLWLIVRETSLTDNAGASECHLPA